MTPLFKREYLRADTSAFIHFTCALVGIGSLGLGRSYSAAGPWLATSVLLMVGGFNMYAALSLMKCMTRAPAYVQTYTDLGYHTWGTFGRFLVVASMFVQCMMLPIAFLVLGGSILLPRLHMVNLTANEWIPCMSLCLLPFTLMRSFREATWVVLLGSGGAIVSIAIAVIQSLSISDNYKYDNPTYIKVDNVFSVFGTYALSLGAAVVLPAIRRDHPEPDRMAFVSTFTFVVVLVIYAVIGALGYHQYGCESPSNLMFAMKEDWWYRLAYLCMFAHVCIAFAVYLNPALYVMERSMFGFNRAATQNTKHKGSSRQSEAFLSVVSPRVENASMNELKDSEAEIQLGRRTHSLRSSFVVGELDLIDEDEFNTPYSPRQKLISWSFRTGVVVLLTLLAMMLQGSFDDFCDFVGATATCLASVIIPCLFYFKLFRTRMPLWDKVLCLTVIIVSTAIGSFVAVNSAKHILKRAGKYTLFEPLQEADTAIIPAEIQEMYCRP